MSGLRSEVKSAFAAIRVPVSTTIRLPIRLCNRHRDAAPFTRVRRAVGVAFSVAGLGIGVDAKVADKRLWLRLYSFGPLAAATQPGQHARPLSPLASIAA